MARRAWPRSGVRTRLPVAVWRRSDDFDPRSIDGLALWLDGDDVATLYTTDAGPVAAVSDPTQISGCVGWWDASDASSITQSGGLVSQWNDKSGQNNHATASGSARPTLTASALNGRSVMTFGGSQGIGGNLTNSISTNAYSVFVVCKITGSITNGRVFSLAGESANDFAAGSVIPCVSNGGLLSAYAGTQAANVSSVSGFTTYGVFGAVLSSNLVANAANGMAGTASAATLSTSVTRFGIGLAAQLAAAYNTCDIAEVIYYSAALSTADRARVESYLAAKWGISGVHAQATATSDPVGYWGDKSGNARHATQATGANRPTVGASSAAGKNAVRNNGTSTVALQVAAWPYTAGNTQFAVFNASALNQAIYQRGSLNDEPRMAVQGTTLGLYATRGGSSAAQTSSIIAYPAATWAIGATLFNTSLGRAYRDGVYGADATDSQTFSGNQELRLLSLPSNIYGINGGVAEFLYYDRQLTAAEVDRVARYLSRKWGITLAPQVSNADAQDWVNRVYANGGTVSASTAAAVNTFCNAIDAEPGLRGRFLRLNLFCGGTSGTAAGLNAAIVPLYRSTSFGGTPVGGATDINNGPFLPADYSETGGLNPGAANVSKYLETGVPSNTLAANNIHLGVGLLTAENRSGDRVAIGSLAGASALSISSRASSVSTLSACMTRYATVSDTFGPDVGTGGAFLGAGNIVAAWPTMYRDGVAIGATATTSGNFPNTTTIQVFCMNNAGVAQINHTNSRMGWYSYGQTMTAGQVTSFTNAIAAFYSQMDRA